MEGGGATNQIPACGRVTAHTQHTHTHQSCTRSHTTPELYRLTSEHHAYRQRMADKALTMMRLGEMQCFDEEQRIAIFEMVKTGALSIEQAHAEVLTS